MKLTDELISALKAVYALHGRKTKQVIRDCWFDGCYNRRSIGEYDSVLQRWRNSKYGHSQLQRISMKKLCEEKRPAPLKAG